jgi:hypothetical protein
MTMAYRDLAFILRGPAQPNSVRRVKHLLEARGCQCVSHLDWILKACALPWFCPLGLELLVGADIISTITAPLTFESVGLLAGIVLIRTFLSFSLETEIEGCWPWQRAAKDARQGELDRR